MLFDLCRIYDYANAAPVVDTKEWMYNSNHWCQEKVDGVA